MLIIRVQDKTVDGGKVGAAKMQDPVYRLA